MCQVYCTLMFMFVCQYRDGLGDECQCDNGGELPGCAVYVAAEFPVLNNDISIQTQLTHRVL
jgi:hypothetical protein